MKRLFAFSMALLAIVSIVQAQGVVVPFCRLGVKLLPAGAIGTQYQWQVNKEGFGFINIADGVGLISTVSGSGTSVLKLSDLSTGAAGYQYRCVVDNQYSTIYTLKLINVFKNAGLPVWENPANWSCGDVPDLGLTNDVIIGSGNNVLLKSTALIRSLTLQEDSKLSVAEGVNLIIVPVLSNGDAFNLSSDDLELLDTSAAPLEEEVSPPIANNPGFSQYGVGDVVPVTAAWLIDSMHKDGVRLSSLKNTTIFGTNDLEADQDGYAYSYGIKQIKTWAKPTDGDNFHKSFFMLGADCSGFIAVVLQNMGINLATFGTGAEESEINKGLARTPAFKNIKLLKKPKVAMADLQNGDILLWQVKHNHTGFYWNDGKVKRMYQSHGNPYPETKQQCKEWNYKKDPVTNEFLKDKNGQLIRDVCKTFNTKEEEQATNIGISRGIHPLTMKAVYDSWGPPDYVYRFTDFEVTTGEASSIQNTTATIKGTVGSAGSSAIVQKGFVWSNNLRKAPTVFNNKTISPTPPTPPLLMGEPVQNSPDSFSTQITDLVPGSTYNVRAFAINATDTAYGESIPVTAGGVLDTLGILISHGIWKAWEGEVLGQYKTLTDPLETMGQPYSSYFDSGACKHMLNSTLRRDTMAYLFNANLSGTYGKKFYDEEFDLDFDNCSSTLLPWLTQYEWFNYPHTWQYLDSTKAIRLTYPPGTFIENTIDLVIESFSPTEMVVKLYLYVPGYEAYPIPWGRIVLR